MHNSYDRPCILIVDDEPLNLQVLKQILQKDYRLLFARDGEKALIIAQQEKPDLILLDIMMPGITGLETCLRLKKNKVTISIPVIFVTALSDSYHESEGFDHGCVDYLTKPVNPSVVLARIKTHLSLVQADQLRNTRLQVIRCLGQAAEYKDNETGMHVIRMSYYAKILAEAHGLSEDFVDNLFSAAPMHDVGKIGIPDAILQKPGKLSTEEWAIMKTHCEIGVKIIGDDPSPLMSMARSIALHHHEKWDGTGYPYKLKNTDIPIEARIIAMADVFDALTSERPYKKAWGFDESVAYIQAQRGLHFDPDLVDLLPSVISQFVDIYNQYQEVAV